MVSNYLFIFEINLFIHEKPFRSFWLLIWWLGKKRGGGELGPKSQRSNSKNLHEWLLRLSFIITVYHQNYWKTKNYYWTVKYRSPLLSHQAEEVRSVNLILPVAIRCCAFTNILITGKLLFFYLEAFESRTNKFSFKFIISNILRLKSFNLWVYYFSDRVFSLQPSNVELKEIPKKRNQTGI